MLMNIMLKKLSGVVRLTGSMGSRLCTIALLKRDLVVAVRLLRVLVVLVVVHDGLIALLSARGRRRKSQVQRPARGEVAKRG